MQQGGGGSGGGSWQLNSSSIRHRSAMNNKHNQASRSSNEDTSLHTSRVAIIGGEKPASSTHSRVASNQSIFDGSPLKRQLLQAPNLAVINNLVLPMFSDHARKAKQGNGLTAHHRSNAGSAITKNNSRVSGGNDQQMSGGGGGSGTSSIIIQPSSVKFPQGNTQINRWAAEPVERSPRNSLNQAKNLRGSEIQPIHLRSSIPTEQSLCDILRSEAPRRGLVNRKQSVGEDPNVDLLDLQTKRRAAAAAAAMMIEGTSSNSNYSSSLSNIDAEQLQHKEWKANSAVFTHASGRYSTVSTNIVTSPDRKVKKRERNVVHQTISNQLSQSHNATQSNHNASHRTLAKRPFSAVKSSAGALKKTSPLQQQMIQKVKEICTKKQKYYQNDEITDSPKKTPIRTFKPIKENAPQQEDDDGSDESNSHHDLSLDLDDDDDEEEEGDRGHKSTPSLGFASTQASSLSSSVSAAIATGGRKVTMLKSVYQGRPSTVFFPYHKSCQQLGQRDLTRTVLCSEIEVKKFDLKFKINGENPYRCVMRAFEEAGFERTEEHDWNVQWALPKKDQVRRMNTFQRYNHYPGCWNLGRKDFMWRCLNRSKRSHPKHFDFTPNTYLLCNVGDWERFLVRREEAGKNQLWISKPSDQACGRGIKVLSKTTKVKRKTNRIISDYIMDPHLINGLKYDLRLYVLVTSYDPLRIYLYDEGLTRFATEQYTTNVKEVTKRYVHLTNYSVNKNAKKFVKNVNSECDGEGSKWSHTALRSKLSQMGVDSKMLFERIADVIIKTCISAEPTMLDISGKSQEHRRNCFELYGFDILIDSKLKPWILEVNVCPSLSSSSPLDRKIKHSLLVDTMNVIGVLPFDKKFYSEEMKKIGVHNRSSVTGIPIEDDSATTATAAGGKAKKTTFSKNLNDVADLRADNCLDKLSPESWEMLFETDEEFYRKGNYQRIYPPESQEKRSYYAQFFECLRFNNFVVDKWMADKHNFLEKIVKKKYTNSV